MQQPEQEQQLPEQQHPQGQEEHQLDYEPLPQRIGANKAKRRRRGEPQPQPPDEPPPPAAVAGAAAAAGACNGAAAAADVDAGAEDEQRQQGMTAYRSAAVGQHKFEYLDHTADVQLHAWGVSLREAFEQVGLALFNYMTPIDGLAPDDACTRHISVGGHDLQSLLFNYLDELLFVYATEYIMMRDIHITAIRTGGGGGDAAGAAGDAAFSIAATGRGEKFDRARHECGTEVKAITYSAMQIRQGEGDAEVFVIVDI